METLGLRLDRQRAAIAIKKCRLLAHSEIWPHRKTRSQSGERRHGRTCRRLYPVAIDPNSDVGQSARRPLPELAHIPLLMRELLASGMSQDCRKCGLLCQNGEPWGSRRRDFVPFA
jgi:hypothetical protein